MRDRGARVYIHMCAYMHASMSKRNRDCISARGVRLVCDCLLQLNKALLNFKKLKVSHDVSEE